MSSQVQEINIDEFRMDNSKDEYDTSWNSVLKKSVIPLYAGVVFGVTIATFKYDKTLHVFDNLIRASVQYIGNGLYAPLMIGTLPITIPIVLCSKLKITPL
jgi:hypothetical protein